MATPERVVIRDFRDGDRLQVARVLVESFPEKVYPVRGVSGGTAPCLVIESGPPFASPFPGNLVAEVDGEVVGTMAVRWRGQPMPGRRELHPRTGRTPWWLRNRVRMAQWVIDERPRPGHCYVSFISVSPDARGLGTGTALLSRGEEVGRERGLTTYSLYVAGSNEGAIRVYQRYGFRCSRILRSRTTGLLLGIPVWWFMEKPIVPR